MRLKTVFLMLVGAQTLHSLEEYLFRLWEVFPPARFLSGLVLQDLERGFVLINISLVLFGWWCFFWPIRMGWSSAVSVAWFWTCLELVNGRLSADQGLTADWFTHTLSTKSSMKPEARGPVTQFSMVARISTRLLTKLRSVDGGSTSVKMPA